MDPHNPRSERPEASAKTRAMPTDLAGGLAVVLSAARRAVASGLSGDFTRVHRSMHAHRSTMAGRDSARTAFPPFALPPRPRALPRPFPPSAPLPARPTAPCGSSLPAPRPTSPRALARSPPAARCHRLPHSRGDGAIADRRPLRGRAPGRAKCPFGGEALHRRPAIGRGLAPAGASSLPPAALARVRAPRSHQRPAAGRTHLALPPRARRTPRENALAWSRRHCRQDSWNIVPTRGRGVAADLATPRLSTSDAHRALPRRLTSPQTAPVAPQAPPIPPTSCLLPRPPPPASSARRPRSRRSRSRANGRRRVWRRADRMRKSGTTLARPSRSSLPTRRSLRLARGPKSRKPAPPRGPRPDRIAWRGRAVQRPRRLSEAFDGRRARRGPTIAVWNANCIRARKIAFGGSAPPQRSRGPRGRGTGGGVGTAARRARKAERMRVATGRRGRAGEARGRQRRQARDHPRSPRCARLYSRRIVESNSRAGVERRGRPAAANPHAALPCASCAGEKRARRRQRARAASAAAAAGGGGGRGAAASGGVAQTCRCISRAGRGRAAKATRDARAARVGCLASALAGGGNPSPAGGAGRAMLGQCARSTRGVDRNASRRRQPAPRATGRGRESQALVSS